LEDFVTMGIQTAPAQLFYDFDLKRHVPSPMAFTPAGSCAFLRCSVIGYRNCERRFFPLCGPSPSENAARWTNVRYG
jgi:hypothetical protein